MSTELVVALLVTAITTVMGGLHALVRYAVKQGIRDQINGQVTSVETKVDKLGKSLDAVHTRMGSHDRRHEYEQRQLIGALDRQGIAPPDGWDTGTLRAINGEGG